MSVTKRLVDACDDLNGSVERYMRWHYTRDVRVLGVDEGAAVIRARHAVQDFVLHSAWDVNDWMIEPDSQEDVR